MQFFFLLFSFFFFFFLNLGTDQYNNVFQLNYLVFGKFYESEIL